MEKNGNCHLGLVCRVSGLGFRVGVWGLGFGACGIIAMSGKIRGVPLKDSRGVVLEDKVCMGPQLFVGGARGPAGFSQGPQD